MDIRPAGDMEEEGEEEGREKIRKPMEMKVKRVRRKN